MPFTMSSRPGRDRPVRTGTRRRTLLAGAVGAALLTGCTNGDSDASRERAQASQRARARAARDSAELLTRYDAVIAAHPALAERLRPLRAEVADHAAAFGDGNASPEAPTTPPVSSAAPSPTDTAPADPKAALAQLADAERQLADARRTALLDVPGEQARLFASVAAAGDAHVYLLTEAAR